MSTAVEWGSDWPAECSSPECGEGTGNETLDHRVQDDREIGNGMKFEEGC